MRGMRDPKHLPEGRERLLFDPRGAERVEVTLDEPGWYEQFERKKRQGWLVRDKAGDRCSGGWAELSGSGA